MKKAVKKSVGRWSKEEHNRLKQALELFGDNWTMIEEFVGTRNAKQIINMAEKRFAKTMNKINYSYEEKKVRSNTQYESKPKETKKSLLLQALPIIEQEEK